jgi:hypothetical protein
LAAELSGGFGRFCHGELEEVVLVFLVGFHEAEGDVGEEDGERVWG